VLTETPRSLKDIEILCLSCFLCLKLVDPLLCALSRITSEHLTVACTTIPTSPIRRLVEPLCLSSKIRSSRPLLPSTTILPQSTVLTREEPYYRPTFLSIRYNTHKTRYRALRLREIEIRDYR